MKHADIHALISRPTRLRKSTLSIYLNVDQSDPVNLNRGFESQLRKMASSVNRSMNMLERPVLMAALHRAKKFVATYVPTGRSLALFLDESDGFFWHKDLVFPIANQIRWDRELLLQPLINALDDKEDYAVVLVDRTKLRLLLTRLGDITEVLHKDLSETQVRHVKSTGPDHAESSNRMQKKADNNVRSNLREVVRALDQFARAEDVHRLVLAGTTETTAELRKMLPTHLATDVIGEVTLAMNASSAEVLAATQPLAEAYERKMELEKVTSVITAAAKRTTAVAGLSNTLHAVNSGRAWEVIYSDDCAAPGFECPACSSLFSAATPTCAYCGASVEAVDNVVARAVEHATRKAARVEVVSGEASASLDNAGGIAAFLKTRTKLAGSR